LCQAGLQALAQIDGTPAWPLRFQVLAHNLQPRLIGGQNWLQAAELMACEAIIQSVWVRMVVSVIIPHGQVDPAKACLPNPLQN
jgi:hypothetical protein